MSNWESLLFVTVVTVIAGTPWVRVAIARNDAAVIKELRIAAMVTVIAIALAWGGWVFSHARQSQAKSEAEVRSG